MKFYIQDYIQAQRKWDSNLKPWACEATAPNTEQQSLKCKYINSARIRVSNANIANVSTTSCYCTTLTLKLSEKGTEKTRYIIMVAVSDLHLRN